MVGRPSMGLGPFDLPQVLPFSAARVYMGKTLMAKGFLKLFPHDGSVVPEEQRALHTGALLPPFLFEEKKKKKKPEETNQPKNLVTLLFCCCSI
jgi:hypothetical protein